MKAEGKTSKAPLTESFGQWKNLKIVILALLGAVAGQAVVWYTGQFYALFFLTQTLKVDGDDRQHPDRGLAADRHAVLHRVRRAVGQDRPQADHHGRLPARRADLLPDVQGADHAANPALAAAQASAPVMVIADPAECSFQFDPIGKAKFTTLLRHRQVGAGQALAVQLRQRGRARRQRTRCVKVGDDRDPDATPPRAAAGGRQGEGAAFEKRIATR